MSILYQPKHCPVDEDVLSNNECFNCSAPIDSDKFKGYLALSSTIIYPVFACRHCHRLNIFELRIHPMRGESGYVDPHEPVHLKAHHQPTMSRQKLVEAALEWQEKYGVAPQITSSLSEYDAAMIVGMTDQAYSAFMQDKTAVSKGSDFIFKEIRYQVKANRPSGKPGSKVTLVAKAANKDWDKLIWVIYDKNYQIQEAWEWEKNEYFQAFENKKRLSPADYRKGRCLFLQNDKSV